MGVYCRLTEESAFLSFYGIRVHFRSYVPDETPRTRIMLLTSPLISTFNWRKLLPELNELNCLTVLVDLPGFGRSSCTEETPQDAAMRANMLWGVLDAIDETTDKPGSMWHLAAHGTACPTIMEMASLCPDSVRSQIHIAPLTTAPALPKGQNIHTWFAKHIADPSVFRAELERLAGYPMDDYIIDRMRKPLMRPGADTVFARMLRAGRKPPECGIGFCPTMVLFGGRDPLYNEKTLTEVKSCLEGAEMHTLKSAGHFPMETHGKALRDYMRGWILYNE